MTDTMGLLGSFRNAVMIINAIIMLYTCTRLPGIEPEIEASADCQVRTIETLRYVINHTSDNERAAWRYGGDDVAS